MAISIAIFLIVIVGALNIISSLVLLVMEKSRDIAILKTMGTPAARVMRIFMLQGTIIGLVGTAIGGILGLVLCWTFDRYRLIQIDIEVYQIAYVPFVVEPLDFLVVIAAALIDLLRVHDLPVAAGRAAGSRAGPAVRVAMPPLVTVTGLSKIYEVGGASLHVLRELDLEVQPGEMVAVVGASGVGKSTMLHLIGGLDRPEAGSIDIGETRITDLSDAARVEFRNRRVGFVFQFHHLLPEFNARENVEMPMRIAGLPRAEVEQRARDLLSRVGLADRADPSAGHAVGRRATARGGGPCPGHAADAAPGRRADGRSGRVHGRHAARPAARDAPRAWADVGHRHAQPATGRRVRPRASLGRRTAAGRLRTIQNSEFRIQKLQSDL